MVLDVFPCLQYLLNQEFPKMPHYSFKTKAVCAVCLPAAAACWCRCARTQWTLSSLWQGAAMDGAVQLSPSTSHCRASLQRKWPEPWQTRWEKVYSKRKWRWSVSVLERWVFSRCTSTSTCKDTQVIHFRQSTNTTKWKYPLRYMPFSKVSPEPDIFILYYIIVSILSPWMIQ